MVPVEGCFPLGGDGQGADYFCQWH